MPILYSPEEKAEILKQHFIGKRPVADICEQYRIDTDVFKKWEKTVYENTDLIFRKHPRIIIRITILSSTGFQRHSVTAPLMCWE